MASTEQKMSLTQHPTDRNGRGRSGWGGWRLVLSAMVVALILLNNGLRPI